MRATRTAAITIATLLDKKRVLNDSTPKPKASPLELLFACRDLDLDEDVARLVDLVVDERLVCAAPVFAEAARAAFFRYVCLSSAKAYSPFTLPSSDAPEQI